MPTATFWLFGLHSFELLFIFDKDIGICVTADTVRELKVLVDGHVFFMSKAHGGFPFTPTCTS
jgi:predicted Rdx family selenoprotein